jgi:hypothetical protein
MKQKLLVAIGVLGLLVMVTIAGLFVFTFVWQPRAVLRSFDEFTLAHHEGTRIEALADDPFLERASDLTFDAESLKDVMPGAPARQLGRLRAQLKSSASGTLEATWTHSPPFGRVFLHVEYADGLVTALKTTDLD